MTKTLTINHVMSNDVKSKIFDDIIARFSLHSRSTNHVTSVKPLNGPLVRHYHRANLESNLINPSVVTVHHDLEETDDWLKFDRFESLYRQANRLICLNSLQAKFLNARGINNTVVIPHGYAHEHLRITTKKREQSDKFTVGIFSKRYPRKVKGEAYLFELFKRLSPYFFRIILVGEGRIHEARFLRGMGYEVHTHEYLPYPVFCSLYEHIDALLMTSEYEGGPASIPEAVATGTPVYGRAIGMVHDLIVDELNGLHLTGNVEYDSTRIMEYSVDAAKKCALRDGAVKYANKAITWDQVALRHEAEYLKLAANLCMD